jgi:hypothetical protein
LLALGWLRWVVVISDRGIVVEEVSQARHGCILTVKCVYNIDYFVSITRKSLFSNHLFKNSMSQAYLVFKELTSEDIKNFSL